MLEEKAYQQIKEMIREGHYSAGDVLSENELCKTLSMSRTPVRVAINRLATEGFVYRQKGHFTTLRVITTADIHNFFQFSLAVEEYAVRYMYETRGTFPLQQMLDLIKKQEESVNQNDSRSYLQLDHAYHITICSVLGNKEIEKSMDNLWEKIVLLVYPSLYERHARIGAESIHEHTALYECLATNKTLDLTLESLRQHNLNARNRLLVR